MEEGKKERQVAIKRDTERARDMYKSVVSLPQFQAILCDATLEF
jgi:hypothetical protein